MNMKMGIVSQAGTLEQSVLETGRAAPLGDPMKFVAR